MATARKPDILSDKLRDRLARLYPGRRVIEVEPLAPDDGATASSTAKVAGYGQPVRVKLADQRGDTLELVWRTASPNEFGHDRRADRAAEAILAFDDFARASAASSVPATALVIGSRSKIFAQTSLHVTGGLPRKRIFGVTMDVSRQLTRGRKDREMTLAISMSIFH